MTRTMWWDLRGSVLLPWSHVGRKLVWKEPHPSHGGLCAGSDVPPNAPVTPFIFQASTVPPREELQQIPAHASGEKENSQNNGTQSKGVSGAQEQLGNPVSPLGRL